MSASLLDHPKQGRVIVREQKHFLLAVTVPIDRCFLILVATHHEQTLQDVHLVVQARRLTCSIRQALSWVIIALLLADSS